MILLDLAPSAVPADARPAASSDVAADRGLGLGLDSLTFSRLQRADYLAPFRAAALRLLGAIIQHTIIGPVERRAERRIALQTLVSGAARDDLSPSQASDAKAPIVIPALPPTRRPSLPRGRTPAGVIWTRSLAAAGVRRVRGATYPYALKLEQAAWQPAAGR